MKYVVQVEIPESDSPVCAHFRLECRMPSRRYIRHSHDPPADALDAMKQDISNALPLNVETVYQNTRRRTAPSTASGSGVYVGIAGMSRPHSRYKSYPERDVQSTDHL